MAVDDGIVIELTQPSIGGCDKRYSNSANNLKIKLLDGTVAQYLHIESFLTVGQEVKKKQIIAKTALNGWLCYPHVHFGVYASDQTLYSSPDRKTLPIYFEGITDGIVRESATYVVP